jgi:arginase
MEAVKIFLASEKAVGLSIAEVNPDHDPGYEMLKTLIRDIVDGLETVRQR